MTATNRNKDESVSNPNHRKIIESISRRISAGVVTWRYPVALVLLLITAGMALQLRNVSFDSSVENMILDDDPYKTTYDHAIEVFGSNELIVLAIELPDLFTEAHLELLDRVTNLIAQVPNVARVVSLTNIEDIRSEGEELQVGPLFPGFPLEPDSLARFKERVESHPFLKNNVLSKDGNYTAINIEMAILKEDQVYREQVITALEAIASSELGGYYTYHLAGSPIVKNEILRNLHLDLITLTPISLAMIFVLLMILFRYWVTVLLPIVAVATCQLWMIAIMTLMHKPISVVTCILPSLIGVIATSGVVHYISEYYRAVSDGKVWREAVIHSAVRVGWPCFLNALTTAVGLGSLILTDVVPVREFGTFAVTGVLLSFGLSLLIALTFLSILPPPSPRFTTQSLEHSWLQSAMQKVVFGTERYSVQILILCSLLLVLSVLGIYRLRVETNFIEQFARTSPVRQSVDFIEAHFAGASTFEVLFTCPDPDCALNPEFLAAMEEYRRFLLGYSEINATVSALDIVKQLRSALRAEPFSDDRLPESREEAAQYLLLYEMSGGAALDSVLNQERTSARIMVRVNHQQSTRMLAMLKEMTDQARAVTQARIEITGITVLFSRMAETLVASQIRSFSFAFLLITVIFFAIFGSWRLGLLAMVPNLLPIAVTLGIMGWFGIALDTSTAMIASVALGIAVDDTIHTVTRYRAFRLAGMTSVAAVQKTMLTIGRAITITSIVFFFGFLILVLGRFIPTRNFGILTAATMVSALAGDLILLPALIMVQDKWRSRP